MHIIGAAEVRVRLSELLERTARGETFEITQDGRPVGKLAPPDVARMPVDVSTALTNLKALRGSFNGGRDELLSLKHVEHRV